MSLLADGLSLSQIRILDPWSTAKLGTLVQASVQGKQVIGIRTIFKAGNGDTDALIVVSGDSVGTIVFAGGGVLRVALDVSALFENIALDPGAFYVDFSQPLKPGMIVRQDGADYVYFKDSVSGFVCIANEANRALVGEQFHNLVAQSPVVGIGQVGVRRRRDNHLENALTDGFTAITQQLGILQQLKP